MAWGGVREVHTVMEFAGEGEKEKKQVQVPRSLWQKTKSALKCTDKKKRKILERLGKMG